MDVEFVVVVIETFDEKKMFWVFFYFVDLVEESFVYH